MSHKLGRPRLTPAQAKASAAKRKAYMAAYRQGQKWKAYQKAYQSRPKRKAYRKAYQQRLKAAR